MTWGEKILAHLAEFGAMTTRDVAEDLGISIPHAVSEIGLLKQRGKIHISKWIRTEDGGRLYPRACYRAGEGRDARKPPPLTIAEYNRRYRSRVRKTTASVFRLAEPLRTARVTFEWRIKEAA